MSDEPATPAPDPQVVLYLRMPKSLHTRIAKLAEQWGRSIRETAAAMLTAELDIMAVDPDYASEVRNEYTRGPNDQP